MTTTAIKAVTQIMIGKESIRGTAVTRTRRIITRDAVLRIIEEQEQFEDHLHGVLVRSLLTPVPTRHHTELELNLDLDFEQILLPLLSGVVGAVTPSEPGSGESRLWAFTPSAVVAVDPTTYSMEYVESNVAASRDDLGKESAYGFTTAFEITGGVDGIATMRMTLAGRKSSSTARNTVAVPTITFAANKRWKLFMDDTWAGLGGTQISGNVYGFTWRFEGFLRPAYYLDGREDLDFVTHEFALRSVNLTVDVVVNPNSGQFVPTEEADKSAQTKRFVQLQLDGAAFDAPDAALARFIKLMGTYVHAPDSMQDRGGDRDGNNITRMHFQNIYDSVSGFDTSIAVQNNLAAFP